MRDSANCVFAFSVPADKDITAPAANKKVADEARKDVQEPGGIVTKDLMYRASGVTRRQYINLRPIVIN